MQPVTDADVHAAAGHKPALRGVQHQWAAVVAAVAGAYLVAIAPDTESRIAAAIYAASLVLLLSISAIYHRFDWPHRTRMWLRRADHASIFLLIGGTYTPVTLLCLDSPADLHLMIAVWSGAAVGIVVSMFWPTAPKWVGAALAIAVGYTIVPYFSRIAPNLGRTELALIVVGGLAYTAGAIVYAAKRPNPWPRTYGYHEIFHTLTLVGAGLHMVAVISIVRGV
jgi:hemolysin III